MTATLSPYLGFQRTAREAIEFYQSVLGGDLTITTFGEYQANQDPADADLVMHSELRTASGFTLMASDTPPQLDHTPGTNFSVALFGDSEDELSGYWTKLADGATITVPLAKAPWGDWFGMLTDRFGVQWLVNISGPAN